MDSECRLTKGRAGHYLKRLLPGRSGLVAEERHSQMTLVRAGNKQGALVDFLLQSCWDLVVCLGRDAWYPEVIYSYERGSICHLSW